MTIPIYQNEFDDGIAEAIKSSASIAYVAEAKPYQPSDSVIAKFASLEHPTLAKAGENDWDLFWLNSILVSVGWNKNDDVFDAGETYAARNSPVHKQFNYMHNERDIIGHMTASIVLDSNGNVIPDDVQTVPKTFDIAVASVLYAQWGDPELQERMDKIIAGIAEDKWFVSMECLFRGFDYAIITPEGEHKILARTEASSFLTKHLRIYGGSGEYEGNRLGRMLRNFTFSGKGLVDNPANPNSIIFNETSLFEASSASIDSPEININLQNNNHGENIMDPVNDTVNQLKSDLAKADQRFEKLTEKFDRMVEEAQASEKAKFEQTIAGLQVDVEDLTAKVDEAKATTVAKEQAIAELEKELKAVKAEKDELAETLAKSEADKVKAVRVGQLVEVGASTEEAEALVERWADSSDEQFADVVSLTQAKFPPEKDEDKDKKDKKDAKASDEDEDGASAADLDKAEVEDDDAAALAAAAVSETEELHESALAWTQTFLSGGDTDNDNN